ncbi:hypothetical protein Tco_1188164, partial [Tanacetum coccineum]
VTAMKIVLKGWILRSLSQELYVGQVCSEIAFEVWNELKKTYDKIDGFVVFDLMHKINNPKQGRTACTCDVKSGNAKHTQLIRLMQFLMGLNEVCQPIRSIILAKDHLPNVKDAFNIYSRKESHRGLHPSVSGGVRLNMLLLLNANVEGDHYVPSYFLGKAFTPVNVLLQKMI